MADIPISILVEVAESTKRIADFTKKSSDELERLSGFGDKLGKTLALAAGAFVSSRIVGALTDTVHAAAEAEKQHEKLINQLRLAGDASDETVARFSRLATELSKVTAFDDDLIKANIGLAKSYGLTNDETEKVIRAAVDLATATGDTLDGAVAKLSQSFNGFIDRTLKKATPAIERFNSEQKATGAVVDLLAEKFGGSAARALGTFTGASANASNVVGNFSEKIGELVTKNKTIASLTALTAKTFEELADIFSRKDMQDGLGAVVDSVAALAKGLVFLTGAVTGIIGGLVAFIGLLAKIPTEALANGLVKVAEKFGFLKEKTKEEIEILKQLKAEEKARADSSNKNTEDEKRNSAERIKLRLSQSAAAEKSGEEIKRIESEIRQANDDTFAKIKENTAKQLAAVDLAAKNGVKIAGGAANLKAEIEANATQKIVSEQEKLRAKVLGNSADIVTKTKADTEQRIRDLEYALSKGAITEEQAAAERISVNKKAENEITENQKAEEDKRQKKREDELKKLADKVNSVLSTIATSINVVVTVSDAIEELDKFQKSIPVTLNKIQAQNTAIIDGLIASIPKALQDVEDEIRKSSDKRLADIDEELKKKKEGFDLARAEVDAKAKAAKTEAAKRIAGIDAASEKDAKAAKDKFALDKKFTHKALEAELAAGTKTAEEVELRKAEIEVESALKIEKDAEERALELAAKTAEANAALLAEETAIEEERLAKLAQIAAEKEQAQKDANARIAAEKEATEKAVLEKVGQARLDMETKVSEKRLELEAELIKKKFELEDELAKKQEARAKAEEEAATKLIGGIASAIGDTLLPGIGGAVGVIVEGLAKGSDFLKEAVLGIALQIPNILANLGDGITKLATGLIEALPVIVSGLIEGAGKLIDALTTLMPKVAESLQKILTDPKTWASIGKSIAKALANGFIAMFESFLNGLIDVINLIPFVDIDHISLPRFAKGGEIPRGFNNDNFPAALSSGELVIPRDTVGDLKDFLASERQGSGGSGIDMEGLIAALDSSSQKQVTFIMKLDERELSKAITDLDRRGFRLRA